MANFDLENPHQQPGDGLRDEAAQLLSVRYGRAKIEHREGGKKVDIYFEMESFGTKIKVYVECKDYNQRLSRADVNHIWADYEGIINKNRPANLLVVTRFGLSSDAKAYIDEHADLRHQTIWDLESDTLGLTPYIQHLRDCFNDGGLSQYYIESKAREIKYSTKEERLPGGEDIEIFS